MFPFGISSFILLANLRANQWFWLAAQKIGAHAVTVSGLDVLGMAALLSYHNLGAKNEQGEGGEGGREKGEEVGGKYAHGFNKTLSGVT